MNHLSQDLEREHEASQIQQALVNKGVKARLLGIKLIANKRALTPLLKRRWGQATFITH